MTTTPPAVINATVPNAPMFDGAKPLVPVWHVFFATLLNRTGGAAGMSINNVTVTSAQISDASAVGRNVLTAPNAAAARAAIGAGTSSLTLASITNALGADPASTLIFTYNAATGAIRGNVAPSGVAPGSYGGFGKMLQAVFNAEGRATQAAAIANVPDLALAMGFGL